jgi:GTP-binding protein
MVANVDVVWLDVKLAEVVRRKVAEEARASRELEPITTSQSGPHHTSSKLAMPSLPTRTPYICQRCIRHFTRRPELRQSTQTTTQWRNYVDSASPTSPHTEDRAPESRPYYSNPTNSQSRSDALSELMAVSEPRRGGRSRPNRGTSFRLAKHFNRDPKLQGTTIQRAPNSALEVKLSDGNSMGYSRHRNPASAERIRPIRKVESVDPSSEERAQAKPTPSDWLPQKQHASTKIETQGLQDCNWYWETIAPTIAQKAQATHFFIRGAEPKFLRSVPIFRAFPGSDVPEVAFVGRSNVGKSSLLNAIVNADTKALLAKTSSTPGFTKTMNLYGVGPGNGVNIVKVPSGHDKIVGTGGITIVDMPGYGEGSLSEWGYEIMKYLQGRKQLRRVFVLLDAQHGIKDKDRSLLASLRLGGIPHQIILSKLDKIYIPKSTSVKHADGRTLSKMKPKGSLKALQTTMQSIRAEIKPPVGGGALGEILGCSSEVLIDKKRLGIDAVRFAVLQAAGLEFRTAPEKKRDIARLVRTIKTDPVPVVRPAT